MRKIVHFHLNELKPEKNAVFKLQGMVSGNNLSERIINLYNSAEEMFFKLAEPKGIFSEISLSAFKKIYFGNGLNEMDTPLQSIFPRADHLALFACTLGKKISQKIEYLFKKNEFPLGAMLDAVASNSADKATQIAEKTFHSYLVETKKREKNTTVLLYSPGYCGWHISAQHKLFEFLKPDDIGISLNSSYLMIPLKSVSGVLIGGNKQLHIFKNRYPFCTQCKDQSCIQRINSLNEKNMED